MIYQIPWEHKFWKQRDRRTVVVEKSIHLTIFWMKTIGFSMTTKQLLPQTASNLCNHVFHSFIHTNIKDVSANSQYSKIYWWWKWVKNRRVRWKDDMETFIALAPSVILPYNSFLTIDHGTKYYNLASVHQESRRKAAITALVYR